MQIDLKSLDEQVPQTLRKSCVYGKQLTHDSARKADRKDEVKPHICNESVKKLESLLEVNMPLQDEVLAQSIDLTKSKMSVKEPVYTRIANSPKNENLAPKIR